MADNFLERRMEDMRSGKLAASVKSKKGGQNHTANKSVVSRRVLIAGLPDFVTESLGMTFSRKGHKVACFNNIISPVPNPAFRNYFVESEEDLSKSFKDLCLAKLDIDIIVCGAALLQSITNLWVNHRRSLLLPNPFGGRLIYVGDREMKITSDLKQYQIAFSQLICSPLFKIETNSENDDKVDIKEILNSLSAAVSFMCSREAGHLSGILLYRT